MISVLLVAPDERLREQVNQAISGASIFLAQGAADALRQLALIDIDLTIVNLTGQNGFEAFVDRAREIAPTSVTLAIGARDEAGTVADFVLDEDHTARQLGVVVGQALEKRRLLCELALLRPRHARHAASPPVAVEAPPHATNALLREFARILAAGFDLTRLLDVFAEAVLELLRPARLAILLPEADGEVYRVREQRGLAPQIAECVRLSPRHGLCHWLTVDGRPVRAGDPVDKNVIREITILQGVLAVPLLARGELVAVLVAGPPVVRSAYAPHEVEVLFDLATHVAGAIQGITLHQQLQRASEFNERILEHMSTGVITIGLDQRVSSMNRRAAEILQLDVAAIVGQDLRALPSPLGDMLHETLMTGRARPPAQIQLALRGLWLELSTYPVDGVQTKGAALVFDDLTAQKELAVQKLQSEQLELLTRVVARVADEIKNPLVSINTFMELIGERFDDSDFRHQFSSVVGRDVRRLVQVLEKLSGLVTRGELHFSTIEVHSVVDDAVVVVTANDDAASEPIEVHVTRESVPLSIKVDPGQLRKALAYLMRYLARHSQGRPSLLVAIGRQAESHMRDEVRVVVASRTAVVPVRELEGLFDPVRMVREDLVDIGPAVSQRIIETLGGSLSMRRSRHEIGFVVRLPLAV